MERFFAGTPIGFGDQFVGITHVCVPRERAAEETFTMTLTELLGTLDKYEKWLKGIQSGVPADLAQQNFLGHVLPRVNSQRVDPGQPSCLGRLMLVHLVVVMIV